MSVFGPLVSPSRIEEALTGTLRSWLHTYLGAVELANGRPVYPAAGHLSRPTADAWHVTAGDALSVPNLRLPRIVVESTGWVQPAESDGAALSTVWGVNVVSFLKGRNDTETKTYRNDYATAITALLLHKGTESDLIS